MTTTTTFNQQNRFQNRFQNQPSQPQSQYHQNQQHLQYHQQQLLYYQNLNNNNKYSILSNNSILISLALIIIDFSLYIIPISFLCIAPTTFSIIFWYLPSIYYFFKFVLTNEKFGSYIKFSLFIASPLIILFYTLVLLPIIAIFCYSYSLFITLISPIILHIKAHEYPYYMISSFSAMVYLPYKFLIVENDFSPSSYSSLNLLLKEFKQEITESQIVYPFKEAINLNKSIWNLYSSIIPKLVSRSQKPVKRKIDVYPWSIFYPSIISLLFPTIVIPLNTLYSLNILVAKLYVDLKNECLKTYNSKNFGKDAKFFQRFYAVVCTLIILLSLPVLVSVLFIISCWWCFGNLIKTIKISMVKGLLHSIYFMCQIIIEDDTREIKID